jgi:hypothetical protein
MHAGNSLQNVHAARLNAQLENGSRLVVEVGRTDPAKRCTIIGQSSEDGLAVFLVGLRAYP